LIDKLSDPQSEVTSQQPEYARNEFRSINREVLVVVAICTHLGCVPMFKPESPNESLDEDWPGGYYCPCHKSKFDLAGRVFKSVPAPTNLVVPPHHYLDANVLVVGTVSEEKRHVG
jgi:ubiquinol-cytochrome c reductase iron-sulfur subunit